MSSPEPRRQRTTAAAWSVRKAKQNPTTANVVDAIEVMHEEFAADLAVLKSDVGKLLHHFGLTSGSPP